VTPERNGDPREIPQSLTVAGLPHLETGGRRVTVGVHRAGLCLLALLSLLYVSWLDKAPAVVGGDEAHFAGHAYSLATTGHDLNGTKFPLFVQITDPLVDNNSSRIWYQPFLFYALALVLKVLPVSEVAVRLPTAAIAVLNIWLVYLIGRRLFASTTYAVVAALFMAMTPAHFIMSRQALDYIGPLPFALAWVWCLLAYLDTRRERFLAAGCLSLGIGVFSYIASWGLMPMYFGFTMLALWRAGLARRAIVLTACAAFAVPIMILLPWLWWHPEMLLQTLGRYNLHSTSPDSTLQRVLAFGDFDIGRRVSLYWDYFNPSFLFLVGGSNPTQATARIGVFLLPVAALLVMGIYSVWQQRRSVIPILLLAGFLTAPLPIAVTMPEAPEYSIARNLMLLPFAALICTFGLKTLFEASRRWGRVAGVGLLLLMPAQFLLFTADYFGDYQVRSAVRLDPINMRSVGDYVVAQDAAKPVPAVFLSDNMDDKSVRWKFYLLKHDRLDLWDRTQYFNAEQLDRDAVEAGSLLVVYAGDKNLDLLLDGSDFSVAATIRQPAGEPSATVLRRNR